MKIYFVLLALVLIGCSSTVETKTIPITINPGLDRYVTENSQLMFVVASDQWQNSALVWELDGPGEISHKDGPVTIYNASGGTGDVTIRLTGINEQAFGIAVIRFAVKEK